MRRPSAHCWSIYLLLLWLGVAAPAPVHGESGAGDAPSGEPPAAESDAGEKSAQADEAAPRHRLAYRFRPGQELRYEIDHRSSVGVRKGEAMQTIEDHTITERRLRVVSVEEDGAAVIEPVIDRVRMTLQFDDAEPVQYDSADESAPPPRHFQEIHRTVGRPTARMRVAPHGELLGLTRLAVAEPVQSAESDGKNPTPKPTEKAESEFQADENLLALLPAEPVPVGHVWKERFTAKVKVDRNIERAATLQREFKLEKVDGNIATIAVRIAIITPVADPAILAQLIQRTPAGTIEFDMERGEIISRTLSQDQTIYGAIGPMSSLRAASELTERRIDPQRTAQAERR